MSEREKIFYLLVLSVVFGGLTVLTICIFTFVTINQLKPSLGLVLVVQGLQILSGIVAIIGVFAVFMLKNFITKEEMEKEVSRLQLEQAQDIIRSLNIQRHDFKNQMCLIAAWAKIGQMEAIMDFVKDDSPGFLDPDAFSDINCPILRALFLVTDTKCRAANIQFSVENDSDLGKLIKKSSAKIHRIFSNLLNNAIEAVIEQCEPDDREITFIVWDNDDCYHFVVATPTRLKKGLNPEMLFEPDFSTKGESGHGMGLHIVQTHVRDLKGEVWCSSRESDGEVEFHVVLPKKSA